MALQKLTKEQRQANMQKAISSRTMRKEWLDRIRNKELSPVVALEHIDEEPSVCKKTRLGTFLKAIPGVGKLSQEMILMRVGVEGSRRISSLGEKQLAALKKELGEKNGR